MIYFDNAATGGFKPSAVLDAVNTTLRYLSSNPGRSGHRLSVSSAKAVFEVREILAKTFFGEPERVVFTKNCTEALNLAIFGTVKRGGHVVATTFEHNSVLRPLYYLQSKGVISLTIVSPSNTQTLFDAVKSAITDKTYMVVCTAVSNVTGEVMPLKDLGELCSKLDLLFLVDGAQGAGHIPLSLSDQKINMLALAGHKGLYGIMGSGALIFDDKTQVSPLLFGGTGSETFNQFQPQTYPERLEAGTINLPAVLALGEGVKYVSKNLDCFANHLLASTNSLISALEKIEGVTLYSKPNPAGIVSFSLQNTDSLELSDLLSNEFDVAVRGGFHCAPKAHEYLKTEKDGLVRVSLAVQNSSNETEHFIRAIKRIASAKFV